MAAPARGDIVLVPFSYSDLRGMKRRPGCVVSVDAYQEGPDVILAMISGAAARRNSPRLGDVVLADWQRAGLHIPSTVRTGRILTLEQRLIERTLGHLSSDELSAVDNALRSVFALS